MKNPTKRLPLSLLPAVPGLHLTQVALAADTVMFTVTVSAHKGWVKLGR
jgi:hypothetical protein